MQSRISLEGLTNICLENLQKDKDKLIEKKKLLEARKKDEIPPRTETNQQANKVLLKNDTCFKCDKSLEKE